MILLSASEVWLWVSTWWWYMKFPDVDQKSFIASPASRSESWECGRDPSDSPRKSILLSPWIGRCRTEVDIKVVISSNKFYSSICDWKNEFSIFWEILPLHWVLLSRFPMRPSFPTPQCLQPLCHPSKFSPRTGKTFFPKWWILDWSVAEIG